MKGVLADWRLCESCPMRRVRIEKGWDGVLMGVDWCGEGCVGSALHPWIGEDGVLLSPKCHRYVEAMVSQLNRERE